MKVCGTTDQKLMGLPNEAAMFASLKASATVCGTKNKTEDELQVAL